MKIINNKQVVTEESLPMYKILLSNNMWLVINFDKDKSNIIAKYKTAEEATSCIGEINNAIMNGLKVFNIPKYKDKKDINKNKYYLVEYYKCADWIGTTIVGAINEDMAIQIAIDNYENIFNEKYNVDIICITVDDYNTESAIVFNSYEEAEKYLEGGYGAIYED